MVKKNSRDLVGYGSKGKKRQLTDKILEETIFLMTLEQEKNLYPR